MDVQLKAYLVVVVLSLGGFFLLRGALASIVEREEIGLWRNHWLAITTILFLAQDFWLFIILTSILLLISLPRDPNRRVPLYFAVLCAAPQVTAVVPGFGGIESFFQINYARTLSLLFFFPLWWKLIRLGDPRGRILSVAQDKYVLAFCIVVILLNDPDTSLTVLLRTSFHVFLDIFLPYYVLSRYLRDVDTVQKVFAAILVSTAIMASIALFEFAKSWLLFEIDHGIVQRGAGYRIRADWLRAQATFGQPIVLGYVLMIGFGAFLGVANHFDTVRNRLVVAGLLGAAQIAPLSRGPWVGLGVLLLIWIGTSTKKAKSAVIGLVLSLFALTFLQFTAFGEKLFRLLPFVGDIEEETADFRVALFENAMQVASRNPWFGTPDYLSAPELRVFEVRWGIVDITNSYLEYLLQYGAVGLALFLLIFGSAAFSLFRSTRNPTRSSEDMLAISRGLLATIGSVMVVIGTVSSITFVPVYYWAIAGVAVGYVQVLREKGVL